ncbi:hypothetical protein BU24DRAFT_421277 [Aaosphaeria arxii CBS 175.79]|uniref:polynucleotide adenylyltransferase n=1 Tax=Aaosphaeria arxii CBS 175.79 TaxID=1450172 RepID=A0A6A5XZR1_9PLEO|nr:uncharacterized protein BU24DRAFT_421277 [Aaosphaeria arxii CBS 175.79]KAF2018297.1 hypothetical protein BU24DRAFT_421277 [Aaosphaeria arxii CBS 175.79]
MAATRDSLPHTAFASTSFDTALCVIPPANKCQEVDQLRALYDKGFGRWPPHINLIYPFVHPENLSKAKQQIESQLSNISSERTLDIALDKAGHFVHRTNSTIWLGASDNTSSGVLEELRSSALQALGQEPSPYNFHLTIGQSEDNTDSSQNFLLGKARLLPHLHFPVGSLAILVRERTPHRQNSSSRMKLWGTIDLAPSDAAEATPMTEFWLSGADTTETSREDLDLEDEDLEEGPTTAYDREAQPGKTYYFDASCSTWLVSHPEEPEQALSTNLTIASYNVLADSGYPPAHDRNALLVDAILSKSGLADILVLQEVSDVFLSYLLANEQVQNPYSFVSHGPPDQADLGPLPNMRNIVILSRWHFDWKLLPFKRRHKGAIVAEFNGLHPSQPLILAGVHLTSGLTDGSVAAKKVQLQNIRSYLAHEYPSSPWIVAGDFNITTSSYTIQTALKSKSISQQTSNHLSAIESALVDAGFIDTWTVARIEGTEVTTTDNFDDLFEGEEGASFNPRENRLAAATSGTSNNRPQRYDRILVRGQNTLRVHQFNQFGLPDNRDGVQIVASDHCGIRAAFKIAPLTSTESTKRPDNLNLLPVKLQQLSTVLSETSTLETTLELHGMFPTKEEIEGRRDAFALIKKIILGSSNDEETIESDIPMVMVSVGSYALGVWTSASDIDCLCIGSISSKTFFKLARQRIHRAQDQGVRFLRRVEASTGTMFEISVNGVSMDLQYCPAARIVERWAELPELHHTDPIYNLSMLSLRKLKPYRDIAYIQRTLPSIPTFRVAYRCIKLWAVQRGIYYSKFGYLGGIHITLMLSWIYKRLVHDVGAVTVQDLVATFFHHYANFDWENEILYDAFFHRQKPRYHRSAREPMVVLGFHAPNANAAHTSTAPGLQTMVKELKMASEALAQDSMTWSRFFRDPGKTGMSEFLTSYQSYVQITIQYWGRSLGKGKGLVGWVESRCLLNVVDINKALPNLDVRIWPARLTSNNASESETDYQGCYLIGLSRRESSETNDTAEDKSLAKQTLQQCLDRFLAQLQSDEKYYDPSTCWIDVSLVQPRAVKDLQLDQREWGDYTPDMDIDSDDEEDAEETDETSEAPYALPIRTKPSSTSTSQSANKLRPASDVLNRLRWDSNLDPSNYIVGYEDRFLGAKETGLERWKTEQTDEEFIPQHRILYFKRRDDGVIVWERKSRTDLIFKSGASTGVGDLE